MSSEHLLHPEPCCLGRGLDAGPCWPGAVVPWGAALLGAPGLRDGQPSGNTVQYVRVSLPVNPSHIPSKSTAIGFSNFYALTGASFQHQGPTGTGEACGAVFRPSEVGSEDTRAGDIRGPAVSRRTRNSKGPGHASRTPNWDSFRLHSTLVCPQGEPLEAPCSCQLPLNPPNTARASPGDRPQKTARLCLGS